MQKHVEDPHEKNKEMRKEWVEPVLEVHPVDETALGINPGIGDGLPFYS